MEASSSLLMHQRHRYFRKFSERSGETSGGSFLETFSLRLMSPLTIKQEFFVPKGCREFFDLPSTLSFLGLGGSGHSLYILFGPSLGLGPVSVHLGHGSVRS